MEEITLQNFDNIIDVNIVRRGKQCYENNAITRLKENRVGEYIAYVRGTDLYHVRIQLDDEDVVEWSCACPYNKGPICKHVVAVLYALADGERDIDESSTSLKSGIATSATVGSMPDDLEKLSKKDLINILHEARTNHVDVDRHVRFASSTEIQFEDKTFVRRIIREAVRDVSRRYGGVEYGDTYEATQGALEVLDVADSAFTSNARVALVGYETVIEELVPVVERSDDSDGDIGGAIYYAFEKLHELAIRLRDQKNEDLRRELLAYILKEWSKKKYQGFDWPWLFLNIAADIVESGNEEEQMTQVLQKALTYDRKEEPQEVNAFFAITGGSGALSSSDWSNHYRQEEVARIQLVLTQRLHPEMVESYVLKNIHLPNVREQAVKMYIQNNAFDEARRLAMEGVKQARQDGYLGTVVKFLELQMECAKKSNRLDEARQCAVQLFLDTHHDAFSYYRHAKEYAGEKWDECLLDIVAKLKKSKHGGGVWKLADVYIEEGMWKELLSLAQDNTALVQTHGKRLAKRFPKEVGRLYIQLAGEGIQYPGGRAEYQKKCNLLREAKRLGCQKEVAQVVEEWCRVYERRRALLEELRKV